MSLTIQSNEFEYEDTNKTFIIIIRVRSRCVIAHGNVKAFFIKKKFILI